MDTDDLSPMAYDVILDEWGCLDDVDVREFRAGVRDLIAHVDAVIAMPALRRGAP